MSELVEKEAVINMLHNAYMGGNEFYDDLFELTEKLPTITPDMAQVLAYECGKAERKKGKWIEQEDGWGGYYYDCSVCKESWTTIDGTPWDNGMNFCPNCGAEME